MTKRGASGPVILKVGPRTRLDALLGEMVFRLSAPTFVTRERKAEMATPMPPLAAPRSAQTLNPFTAGEVAVNAGNRGVVAVEQQRAIAEVQARMIIARANPRDPIKAMEKILNDCTRPTLANHAIYQYARGGTDIRGPSIRLAEAIAQRWGNIASGIKEMSRAGEYSECIAYAWDLKSGLLRRAAISGPALARHWQGGYQLHNDSESYELIANFGQRRKRAVLLTIIPGDVTEAALERSERPMSAGANVTPDGIKKLVEAFTEFRVTSPQIEARIQRRLNAIRPAQVVMLRKIYTKFKGRHERVRGLVRRGAAAARRADEGSGPHALARAPQEGGKRRRR